MNLTLHCLFLLEVLTTTTSAFPFETAVTPYQLRNSPKDRQEILSSNSNISDDSIFSADKITDKFNKRIYGVFKRHFTILEVDETTWKINSTADTQHALKADIINFTAFARNRRDSDDDKPADSGDDADAENDPENPEYQDNISGGSDPNGSKPSPDYQTT